MRKLPPAPKPKKLATKHRRPSKPAASRSGTNNIETHSYDQKTQQLIVTFSGGRRYAYSGVSAETAAGLADAESKGRYLHANVFGKHEHSKISD